MEEKVEEIQNPIRKKGKVEEKVGEMASGSQKKLQPYIAKNYSANQPTSGTAERQPLQPVDLIYRTDPRVRLFGQGFINRRFCSWKSKFLSRSTRNQICLLQVYFYIFIHMFVCFV